MGKAMLNTLQLIKLSALPELEEKTEKVIGHTCQNLHCQIHSCNVTQHGNELFVMVSTQFDPFQDKCDQLFCVEVSVGWRYPFLMNACLKLSVADGIDLSAFMMLLSHFNTVWYSVVPLPDVDSTRVVQ